MYSSLLQKATEDANAVAILRSKSLWSQALNLWRSLFETEVVCHYIGNSPREHHLPCRYATHSVLLPTIRRWKEFNESCRRLGQPETYSPQDIERQECICRKEFGERRDGYAWTRKEKHNTFEKIAQATETDMLFYRIASNEVHATFGEAAAMPGAVLPIPMVPLVPVGVVYTMDELSLEFQTASR